MKELQIFHGPSQLPPIIFNQRSIPKSIQRMGPHLFHLPKKGLRPHGTNALSQGFKEYGNPGRLIPGANGWSQILQLHGCWTEENWQRVCFTSRPTRPAAVPVRVSPFRSLTALVDANSSSNYQPEIQASRSPVSLGFVRPTRGTNSPTIAYTRGDTQRTLSYGPLSGVLQLETYLMCITLRSAATTGT